MNTNPPVYEIGTAKVDITTYVKGKGMLGYGMTDQVVEGVATPIHARAFAIKSLKSNKKIIFVNAELCFITPSLKKGVVRKLNHEYPELGYHNENIMLTAQHTHSAPGGYSHFGLYNISVPGYLPKVYDDLVEKITQTIVKADENFQMGYISYDWGRI